MGVQLGTGSPGYSLSPPAWWPQGSEQIPRTWDDDEIARHEVPLAQPEASPKHVSSECLPDPGAPHLQELPGVHLWPRALQVISDL